MTDKVPYLAPGCYGSALMFNREDMVCPACPFVEQCEPAHLMALSSMREKFGIKDVAPKKISKKEKIVDDPERMTLPKKVRELLRSLDTESLDIVRKMKDGINPFSNLNKFRYMQVACHLILHLKTPVNHKLISAGMKAHLKWADGTSNAHARMAIQALEHVGAIENKDGIISVRRD